MWPYCAYMCIMGCQTTLQEEVFLLSHQKDIFHFPSIKNGRFCEATTKWLIQKTTTTFYKNTRPPYMDNVSTGDLKPFRPPMVKKTNSCRIGRKWVRYELRVHDTMLMIFYKNHF